MRCIYVRTYIGTYIKKQTPSFSLNIQHKLRIQKKKPNEEENGKNSKMVGEGGWWKNEEKLKMKKGKIK